MPEKVALIGSGNWGSAIATKIGKNVLENDISRKSYFSFENAPLSQTHENAALPACLAPRRPARGLADVAYPATLRPRGHR